MSVNNPTQLKYKFLEEGHAPKYGVTSSSSDDFSQASFEVFAWFTTLYDAKRFVLDRSFYSVWDLEEARKI